MKTGAILGGIIITGAVISVGSTALGAASRNIKENKHLKNSNKKIQSAYNNTMNSLTIRTMNSLTIRSLQEKNYLQSVNSFQKSITKNDDGIKILTKTAR